MKKTFQTARGFSLIELMVVVAIIGILTALIIVNIASSRAKARDARRVSDLAQIQLALEQYFSKNNVYPNVGQFQGNAQTPSVLIPTYISKLPTDPDPQKAYIYAPEPNNHYDYIIQATLEKPINEGLGGLQQNGNGNALLNGYQCNPATVYYCVGPK